MASKRRIGHLIGGMRLGDMAAALEGRHLRRAEQRDADEREARRFNAGHVAISQLLGGLSDLGDRQERQRRQAMLDEERRSDREFERSRLTADDKRRQADHEAKRRDRSLTLLTPGMDARADDALKPDDTGAWIFDGSLEGNGGVEVVDAKGSAVDDMVTTLESAGFSRAEAESLARGALRGAEGRQAQRMASSQAADRQAADDERKARIAEAQLALTNAKTEAEKARARKALAEARRASRPASEKPKAAPPRIAMEALQKTRSALREIEELRDLKKGVRTGPLQSRVRDFKADHSPWGDPEWAKFKAKAKSLLKTIAKAKEGGRLTDFDMKFYEEALMNTNQQDENFEAVLGMLEAELQRDLAAAVEDERALGRDVSTFESRPDNGARKPTVEEEDAVLRELGVM